MVMFLIAKCEVCIRIVSFDSGTESVIRVEYWLVWWQWHIWTKLRIMPSRLSSVAVAGQMSDQHR